MQEMWVQSLDQGDLMEKEMTNLFQYSCPGYRMDRGAWQATVHGAVKESVIT